MHSAIRAGQVDETLTHDPYSAANDNIAEHQQTKTTAMPAPAILSWLITNGHIGADERDAGEHVIKLAAIARSALTKPVVRYSVRTADRKWRTVEVQRHTIRGTLDGIFSAIRYEPRRKAVVQAFAIDEATVDLDNPHRVAQGLADVARHLWGGKAEVVQILVAANDNQPDVEKAVAAGGTFRASDNFEKLRTSQKLHTDADINDALHAAGVRYSQDHHDAGLSPLGAIDYSRVVVDGGSGQTASERSERARRRYRTARETLTSYYSEVIDGVVIDGLSLGEVGLKISSYKNRDLAGACAKERLIGGLRILMKFYGIQP